MIAAALDYGEDWRAPEGPPPPWTLSFWQGWRAVDPRITKCPPGPVPTEITARPRGKRWDCADRRGAQGDAEHARWCRYLALPPTFYRAPPDPKTRKPKTIDWASLKGDLRAVFERLADAIARPYVREHPNTARRLYVLRNWYEAPKKRPMHDAMVLVIASDLATSLRDLPALQCDEDDPPEPLPDLAEKMIVSLVQGLPEDRRAAVLDLARRQYRCPSAKCRQSADIEQAARRAFERAKSTDRRQKAFERRMEPLAEEIDHE